MVRSPDRRGQRLRVVAPGAVAAPSRGAGHPRPRFRSLPCWLRVPEFGALAAGSGVRGAGFGLAAYLLPLRGSAAVSSSLFSRRGAPALHGTSFARRHPLGAVSWQRRRQRRVARSKRARCSPRLDERSRPRRSRAQRRASARRWRGDPGQGGWHGSGRLRPERSSRLLRRPRRLAHEGVPASIHAASSGSTIWYPRADLSTSPRSMRAWAAWRTAPPREPPVRGPA